MKNEIAPKSLQKTLLDALNHKLFDCKFSQDDFANPRDNLMRKDVVIVCFGTPLISGDAFAPIVARELKAQKVPFFVYGTQEHSVNGKNMEYWLDFIKTVHKDCLIIAIDASLGQKVGEIVVRKDGVCPAAIKGRSKRFGDIGILGVVAKNEGDALMQLMSADYDFVEKMALDTAKAVASLEKSAV